MMLCITTACCLQTVEKRGISSPESPVMEDNNSGFGSSQSIVDANNRFACELYLNISHNPGYSGKNIFFSPYTITSAGALTYEGARGRTAKEIRDIFHFPVSDTVLREGYTGMDLNSSGSTLYMANGLWANQRFPFLPEYLTISNQYYGANIMNLDFANKSGESRDIINTWIASRTENKIQNLLSSSSVNPATRLIITNSIYFKGSWETRFNKGVEQVFRIEPHKGVKVQMMERTDSKPKYQYTDTGDVQVLDIPYVSGDKSQMSMLILLPKGDSIFAAEHLLTMENISSIVHAMEPKEVKIYFPKYRIETEYQLPDLLKKMGMVTPFTRYADFSGMIGKQDIFIDNIIHKAFIEVNEEGTEAASTTVTSLNGLYNAEYIPETSVIFNVDHPFIFLICDHKSGIILFIGQVMDPTGAVPSTDDFTQTPTMAPEIPAGLNHFSE
ncbi:serpin family protein [Methanospirillum lacunae]|uniref:Proteinase IV n=1 Tax=Methanospirillum lacunae TaxID=668570 RepID=A0A2V2MWI5_9EURY|nr:serpin family protein [Methanospirillum lacunae]PWR72524.1 proteinase IV [Methanospirillum lacunae]